MYPMLYVHKVRPQVSPSNCLETEAWASLTGPICFPGLHGNGSQNQTTESDGAPEAQQKKINK